MFNFRGYAGRLRQVIDLTRLLRAPREGLDSCSRVQYQELMFAELLGCSSFSFLRGASHPHELVARAKGLELPALALCDRDGLYGSARAFIAGRELSQRVIVGAELTLGDGSPRRGVAAPKRKGEV